MKESFVYTLFYVCRVDISIYFDIFTYSGNALFTLVVGLIQSRIRSSRGVLEGEQVSDEWDDRTEDCRI